MRAAGRHAGVRAAPRAWRNGTIEHFNDTFDKRFFRPERFADLGQLGERAGAFERFHNAQHCYSATRGLMPEQTTTASAPRGPIALAELPAGWPAHGKVEFIRFIRSDHKLRILGCSPRSAMRSATTPTSSPTTRGTTSPVT